MLANTVKKRIGRGSVSEPVGQEHKLVTAESDRQHRQDGVPREPIPDHLEDLISPVIEIEEDQRRAALSASEKGVGKLRGPPPTEDLSTAPKLSPRAEVAGTGWFQSCRDVCRDTTTYGLGSDAWRPTGVTLRERSGSSSGVVSSTSASSGLWALVHSIGSVCPVESNRWTEGWTSNGWTMAPLHSNSDHSRSHMI